MSTVSIACWLKPSVSSALKVSPLRLLKTCESVYENQGTSFASVSRVVFGKLLISSQPFFSGL